MSGDPVSSRVDARERPANRPRPNDGQCGVLIVEDDEGISNLLAALLEEIGYTSRIVRNGRTAIRLARELRPRLITLDLSLPGIDGCSVLRKLKSDPETCDIPVVVISAFTQVLPAGERKKLTYLVGKPFNVDEVLEVIRATVGSPYL